MWDKYFNQVADKNDSTSDQIQYFYKQVALSFSNAVCRKGYNKRDQ